MSLRAERRSPLLTRMSLYQPHQPAFWLYVAILAVTGLATVGQESLLRQISPSGWVLSWGLLVVYALPVFVVVYVLDLYEREPVSLLIGALLWGAIAAPTFAGYANDGWGLVVARAGGPEFAARWSAALTAPLVEEILKGLGVVMIYLIARSELDDVLDGFVYGAICGLGFAVVEDVFYFMAVFGGRPTDVLQGFFLRVVASGLYSHVLYTGLVGMGIGYVVTRRERVPLGKRLAVAGGLSAIAVFAHFLWNSPLVDLFPKQPWTGSDWLIVPIATAVKGVPLLAFVVIAVRLARGRERRWLHDALASEVGGSAVSASELADLESPRRRRAARRSMRLRAGAGAATIARRLQREQINLAMVRARVATEDDPAILRQRDVCASLRAALQAIPGAAPADASAPGAPATPG